MVGLQKEIKSLSKLLNSIGLGLEQDQPHVQGERFLASPDKLVLVGKRKKDGKKVIIKTSWQKRAKEEIKQEKKVRDIISSFAPFKKAILIPDEIYFGKKGKYQIFVTEFIDQEKVFISHPIKKQFETILEAFTKREVLNGNTFSEVRKMYKDFPFLGTLDYIKNFKTFQKSVLSRYRTPGIEEAMNEGFKFFKENKSIINSEGEHLVHSDFAPHNFRLKGNSLYTLDCSAFIFGNKHEELARLLNYMSIHNPVLEKRIKKYIYQKRGRGAYLNLRLIRIYKILLLLNFYADALAKTTKDLLALTTHRIEYYEELLRVILQDRDLDPRMHQVYLENRDHLRSEEEKKRQKEFAKA